MNKTSNTTEKNNAQPVFNYAQAVKKSSQNSESQGAENNDASSVANETKSSEVKNVKVDELSSVSEASKDEQSNEVKSEPLTNKIDSAQLPRDLEKNNEDSKSSVEEKLTNADNTSTPHKSNASELEHNPSSSHSNSEKHNSSNDQSGYHKKPMSPNNTGNWQGNQYYRHSQYYGRNSYSADKPSYNSPTFVPQLSVNKAIPIINPDTSEVINLSARSSSTNSPSNPSSKTEEHKDVKIASTPSRAIKIVNPNEKEEEAEQKAKEEAEQKEKEEAEQKAKEEAEQKAKEEAEQKEKEEAEQKAKEEAEQKAKEEAEQKAKEEAEQKAKVEAEQKTKVEAEQKTKEEAEQKAKEETEMKPTEQAAEKETDEKHEAEVKDNESKIGNEEERIAAITADKIARGAPPSRLDMSAIPAHVFHDSPVSTPTSIVPPKVKRSPLPVIEDFSAIEYPADIVAPTGKDSVTGRISYKRAFLLQFQKLCTETDEDLSQIPAASEESSSNENRRGMSRRQTSERGRGPRTPGGSGDNMFRNNSRDGRGEMGKFSGGRSLSHRQGSNGPSSGMERQGSQGGRNRSNRGGKSRHPSKEQVGAPTLPPEQVVPLAKSANRWVPAVIATSGTASTTSEAEAPAEAELISQEMIARKVKALLNKLTIERFDSISDQIWEYAKQSEKEDNGQSLRTVIQLVFDKACDEPNFAGMWAQLCKKMYDVISQNTDIKDVNILDKNNEPVSSGPLYRKYLLNRCQQEFEKGWKSNLPKMDENSSNEMLTDEYYAAAKAKRQGLGLVQFVGELYRRQMLSDRVMIECLMRLCSDPQQPEDDETETMCKLLTTIGQTFEVSSRKNKEWLDTYFERMKEMYKSPILSSRIKFKILDVFDLRKSKWTLKRGNQPAPTTIAEIHEQAKKASEEKESMKRSSSSRGTASHPVSRQGSHRGGGRPL
ncbi:MAG: hypothetical protein EXX96DRAFT_609335 [Benjaminiella poitrasii]|nr:MAG: hypothetical protein EXX96DRAFT_609335 [Benjaminiella poitrasii]